VRPCLGSWAGRSTCASSSRGSRRCARRRRRGAQVTAEIREHPIVKLASELFDAAIVDVTPLRREEAATADDALVAQAVEPTAPPRTVTADMTEGDED
jgi:hypothetical protein